MKKLIVVSVIFALVAGAAFAETTVGGQLQMGMIFMEGNNVTDDDVKMGGSYTGDGVYHEAKLSAVFGDGRGGGRLVWRTEKKDAWGWLQWRPNQFLRVKMGHDRDGEWGAAQITGWGFTGEAKNAVAAVNDWGGHFAMGGVLRANAFFGGIGDGENTSVELSFYPIDGLSASLFLTNVTDNLEISDHLSKAKLHVVYAIEDIGTVRFTAAGKGALATVKDEETGDKDLRKGDIADLFLSFYSKSIVQGLAFDVGFKFNLPHMDADSQGATNIGLGLAYDAGSFNVKVRTGVQFGAKDAAGKEAPAEWGIGILPNYRINPNLIVFFHAGFRQVLTDEEGAQKWGWFINPYIWVRAAEGLRFWTGIQILDQEGVRENQIKWIIPFGFNFYF